MAAGLVVRNLAGLGPIVVPMGFWADDTAAPTELFPAAVLVDSSGVPIIGPVATATLTSVNNTTSSAQLLAANTARRGVIAANTSGYTMYIKFGTSTTTSSFTLTVPANGTWVMDAPVYTGYIGVTWAGSDSGKALVTELS